MADTKISALAAAASLADTDELVLASAGANKKITGANLKASMPTPGALTLLSSTTLASPGTFDVSGISQAYNDLLIIVIARGTVSGFSDSPVVRLNNDAASNYYSQRIRGSASVASAQEQISSSSFGGILQYPAASSPAGLFGVQAWTFTGYSSTAWLKNVLIDESSPINTGTGAIYANRFAALWASTAAINRFSYTGSSGTPNLATGSQLRIYGRL